MSEITLDGLTKEYGSLTAVESLNLTIPDDSYTMILGPSGCGKSTTLRMIAGLETPTEGAVRFGEEDVTDRPPRKRDLSMVFQNLALWDHKSVRENIEFGLKMRDVSKDKRRERTQEIAEILQIEDKLDDSPSSLSGGQQQRVALGRSLVREPEVILLDEPLSSLDAKLRIEMRTELLRIQRQTGISFVHVTHSQEDAMSIADEILLLNDGELQQFGDPMELFNRPSNRFVADFIGTPSMNLFKAQFVDGGTPRFETDTFELQIPSAVESDFRDRLSETDIEAGVRPNDMTVLENGALYSDSDRSQFTFDATVTVVETYGDNSWYYLDVGLEEEFVLKSADEEVINHVSEGDDVTVGFAPEDIHVFDDQTGDVRL